MNNLIEWPFNTDVQTPMFPAFSYEARMEMIAQSAYQWLEFLDKGDK